MGGSGQEWPISSTLYAQSGKKPWKERGIGVNPAWISEGRQLRLSADQKILFCREIWAVHPHAAIS